MRSSLLLLALAACTGSAVRTQSLAADAVARAFNQVALPSIVGAFERECRDAILSACPSPPCERAVMVAALRRCEARWEPVVATYEAARAAHAVWRAALLRCQDAPDGGACAPDMARDGAAFLSAAAGYRCAVRALGRADLDPLPGAAACGGPDGGRHDP